MGPHPRIHGRRDDHPGPAGGDDGRDRVVDQACGQLAEEVGRGRREDDRVCRLGQLDVGDVLIGVEGQDVGHHRAVGERGEGERSDEGGRGRGHGHVHDGPRVHELADEDGRLVGRDAAADPDHHPAADERPVAALGHARASDRAPISRCGIPDAAQGELRLHPVNARHVGEPRLEREARRSQ